MQCWSEFKFETVWTSICVVIWHNRESSGCCIPAKPWRQAWLRSTTDSNFNLAEAKVGRSNQCTLIVKHPAWRDWSCRRLDIVANIVHSETLSINHIEIWSLCVRDRRHFSKCCSTFKCECLRLGWVSRLNFELIQLQVICHHGVIIILCRVGIKALELAIRLLTELWQFKQFSRSTHEEVNCSWKSDVRLYL